MEYNEPDFKVYEVKRLMGLEVHRDVVKKIHSLA